MKRNKASIIALCLFVGILAGCAVNPSKSAGTQFQSSDSVISDKSKAKLVLWRNWHFVNGGVPSAFFINDKLVCEFRSGVCSFEMEPGEYNISFALPTDAVEAGTKASEYKNNSFVSNMKVTLKPDTVYSIYSDGHSRTSGLIEGIDNSVYGSDVYTPNTTDVAPLVGYAVVMAKTLEQQAQAKRVAAEKERIQKEQERIAQAKRLEQERLASEKARLEQEKQAAEKLRLAQIEAAKSPQQKALEQATKQWNSDRRYYLADLDDQYDDLESDWRNRCEDILYDFFQADLGPGEHVCNACERCKQKMRSALTSFDKKKARQIEQWDRNHPKPTMESIVASSAPAAATSQAGKSDINIKKIHYKGEYATVTSDIPEIYYGTYVFTKEDTPGFDQTYHFNRDGTGYFKHNPDGPMKTKKITQWGVLVENNKIFKTEVKYHYWTDRKASAMIVVYLFEDGTAGNNSFFLNDEKPSVFGPYGAVIGRNE